ncbi:SPOR domain-containing protein [Gracilinema caldarium]|uniref:Sporulation domain-containing protein n=1 Tax=Gracilinema caldarium (strain ATCC 51460 / DSM 7334 / H1) TaxID=744872 RepID=F8F0E0_GRAC1|nr:SPOR domain-containing protein [Gracilinema caldarium]AEJ19284.1 Sporulation domain-containing protein [Gracilinema caldarium DSM 7334]
MRYLVSLSIILCILNTALLLAQTQSVSELKSLAQDLEQYQKLVQTKDLPGPQKKAAWLSLAQLQVVNGEYMLAATGFTEAAFSVTGSRDDKALVKAAQCYLYAGDVEHASSHVKTLLLTSQDSQVIEEAQRLGLLIDILRGENNALQHLEQIRQSSKSFEQKPILLYILYILTGKEEYADILKKNYTDSIETAMLENKRVVFKYSPLWLLRLSDVNLQPLTDATSTVKVPENERTTQQEQKNSSEVLLQVGLFSQQNNAQQMADRLQKKGFTATIGKRTLKDTSYWVVTIPGGTHYNDTLMQLKDAGFEAFPLFN